VDYSRMDFIALRREYGQEMEKFKQSLLNGTPWEEVQQCQLNVTAVSNELHNRLQLGSKHPAEYSKRSE
jgi:hypothetical protein